MERYIILTLLTLCTSLSSDAARPQTVTTAQPEFPLCTDASFQLVGESCMSMQITGTIYTDAAEICRLMGANILVINTEQEFNDVLSFMISKGANEFVTWLGCTSPSGAQYTCVNNVNKRSAYYYGETSFGGYWKWAPNFPNIASTGEMCALMLLDKKDVALSAMYDDDCTLTASPVICEKALTVESPTVPTTKVVGTTKTSLKVETDSIVPSTKDASQTVAETTGSVQQLKIEDMVYLDGARGYPYPDMEYPYLDVAYLDVAYPDETQTTEQDTSAPPPTKPTELQTIKTTAPPMARDEVAATYVTAQTDELEASASPTAEPTTLQTIKKTAPPMARDEVAATYVTAQTDELEASASPTAEPTEPQTIIKTTAPTMARAAKVSATDVTTMQSPSDEHDSCSHYVKSPIPARVTSPLVWRQKEGACLRNHVSKRSNARNVVICASRCGSYKWCHSFNYYSDDNVCELNEI